ncbi:MAG: hypothetical protein LUD50_01590 [Clostridia bacterium]|nr:hypothetical protein [Clostridia bacterium]
MAKAASTKGQKIGVLVLYIVILLGLLAGFLIPMNIFSGETVDFNTSLCMQIPAALNAVLNNLPIGWQGLTDALVSNGGTLPDFAIASEMTLAIAGLSLTIDFNAWLTIIYAVVTVIAIICIIPAIVGCVQKLTKAEKAAEKADSEAAEAVTAAQAAAEEAGYIQDENGNWKNPYGRYTYKDEDGDPFPVNEHGEAFPADETGTLVIPAVAEDAEEKTVAVYKYANAYAAEKSATAKAKAADAAAAEAVANKKAKKETTYHTAFTLEVIAAVVLLLMVFFTIMYMDYNGGSYCAPVAIAFAVVLIVGFVQRCVASKGSGAAKFILFLLALIAVGFAFFDIATLSGSMEGYLSDGILGFSSGVFGGTAYAHFGDFLFSVNGVSVTNLFIEGMGVYEYLFAIGGIIVSVMLLFNCLFALIGIYKKTNKFMLVADQVTYLLEIAGLVLCIVGVLGTDSLAYASEGETVEIGFMFIAVCALAVIAYVIDLVRLIMYNKAKKKAKAEAEAASLEEAVPEETDVFDEFSTGQAVPADGDFVPADGNFVPADGDFVPVPAAADTAAAETATAEAAPEPAPAVASDTYYPPVTAVEATPVVEDVPVMTAADVVPQVQVQPAAPYAQNVQNASVIYNVHSLYNGPSDKFIAKLTNDEKVEFAKVFLERVDGPLTVIPEYKIGGDNTKFFTNVIIYYARVRDLISDSLMDKLYEEINVM